MTKDDRVLTAKVLLARHLRALMSKHASLTDRKAVAKKASISPRLVGYMLQENSGNPTLASIEAVAGAFGLRAWQLLIDVDAERQRLTDHLFEHDPSAAADPAPARAEPRARMVLHQPLRPYKVK